MFKKTKKLKRLIYQTITTATTISKEKSVILSGFIVVFFLLNKMNIKCSSKIIKHSTIKTWSITIKNIKLLQTYMQTNIQSFNLHKTLKRII